MSQAKRNLTMKGAVWGVSLAIAATLTGSNHANAELINFDDGNAGNAIGSFYSSQDAIFSNASWREETLDGSSPPMVLASIDNQGAFVPPSDPIVVMFPTPVSEVSITALDVGEAGAEMDAYDATSGGNLVATDQQSGAGLGVGAYVTLTNDAPNIQRIELFQPAFDGNDGILWDDLSFTEVPEPASLSLLVIAAPALLARRSRKRTSVTSVRGTMAQIDPPKKSWPHPEFNSAR